MRDRDEIEKEIRKSSQPTSGLMNTGTHQQLVLEVLLDIRELLLVNSMLADEDGDGTEEIPEDEKSEAKS